LGRGYHHVTCTCHHHFTFGYCTKYKRIRWLGWVKNKCTYYKQEKRHSTFSYRRTKKKNIYVISTLKRPVPLEHHLYANKEIYKIVGANEHKLSTVG
jgi:hypothetical protein